MDADKNILVFDAMGVVYPFPEGDDVTYGILKFLKEKGYDFSNEMRKNWEKKRGYNQATRGMISSIHALQLLIPSTSDEKLRELEEEYLTSDFFKLDGELLQVIESVKKDFLIGMLSNDIPDWSIRLRKRFNLERYFDFFVISGIGNTARKPEKEIYKQLLDVVSIEHKANLIYFIDDSLKNLKVAKEFNFITIYKILKSNDNIDYIPDHKIKKLMELENLFTSINK